MPRVPKITGLISRMEMLSRFASGSRVSESALWERVQNYEPVTHLRTTELFERVRQHG